MTVSTLPVVGNSVYVFLRFNAAANNYYYFVLSNYLGGLSFTSGQFYRGLTGRGDASGDDGG